MCTFKAAQEYFPSRLEPILFSIYSLQWRNGHNQQQLLDGFYWISSSLINLKLIPIQCAFWMPEDEELVYVIQFFFTPWQPQNSSGNI